MANKFRIKIWKQLFLIYIPIGIELIFHFFGEHFVEMLMGKYPDKTEAIHNLVVGFHAFLWLIIIYGVIHIMIEFIHHYGEIIAEEKQIVDSFQNLPLLVDEFRGEIKETYPTQHVGVVKKITASNIWDFQGKVIGWNPNWSIEINSTHELHGELLDIHLKRLKSKDVQTIQYIFVDGYAINKSNSEKFGWNNFLQFLTQLNSWAIKKGHKNGITRDIKKYKILVIPKDRWSDEASEIGKEVNYYKNFIFIGGIREKGKSSLILFINKKGFLIEGKHEYYIEIFNDNQIYSSLTSSFDYVGDLAYQLKEYYTTVEYNSTTKKFSLKK